MKSDGRLSGVLHLLLHMAQTEGPSTSEVLAQAMATNPVVVRRVLAGLRERGLVRSERGHGGGWAMARPLSAITLHEVYEALGRPPILAIGNRSAAPSCLVEQAVNAALDDVFARAEAVLLEGLAQVTLDRLEADFLARLAARGQPHSGRAAHDH